MSFNQLKTFSVISQKQGRKSADGVWNMALIGSMSQKRTGPHTLSPGRPQLKSNVTRFERIGSQNAKDHFSLCDLIAKTVSCVLSDWEPIGRTEVQRMSCLSTVK